MGGQSKTYPPWSCVSVRVRGIRAFVLAAGIEPLLVLGQIKWLARRPAAWCVQHDSIRRGFPAGGAVPERTGINRNLEYERSEKWQK